ncbi:hypothetical protein ABPG74_020089 [Tetrahymena malaccensis]
MDFTQIDLFKQPFSFYFKNKNDKKGSFMGAFLSSLIISSVLAYFIYQIKQYFENQIEPKFRSQSFITNQQAQIDLHEDLISFKFTYNQSLTIDEFQAQSKQTYLVYQAYFIQSYKQKTNFTQLNIIKCSNPQLSDYNCLDLSSIPEKTMLSNFQDRNYYSLMILVYGCNALDGFKTTIPSNCANQTDIDNFLDSSYAEMSLKFYVTQYNITSQMNQVNYRNSIIYPASNQYSITTYKAEQQTTTVNKGFIIQSESVYSGPIQYNQESQTFNQPNNQNPYIELTLKMDEIIQVFQIQFPTFPEVLALPQQQQTQIQKKQIVQKDYVEESIIDQPENSSIQNIPKFQTQIMKSQMQNKQLNNEIQSFEISQNENLNKKETINKFIFSSIQNPKQNIVDQSIKQEESQTFFMQNLNQQSFTPFDQKPIQQKFYSSPANKEESAITIDQNIYQSQYNGSPNNQKLNYKNSQTYDKFSSFNPNNKNNFEYYTQKLKVIQDANMLKKANSMVLNTNPPINQDKKDIKTKNNYLEKQQNILDSEEQQSKYILRFLKRCNAKQDINYLDQRIFQCITGNKLV